MTRPSTPPPERGGRFRRATRWWLAAGTFVIGIVAGAIIAGLLSEGSSVAVTGSPAASAASSSSSASVAAAASAAASSSAQAEPSKTAQVIVSDECLRAINAAQDAYAAINQIADAVKNIDLSALDGIIRQLQPLQSRLQNDIKDCQVAVQLPNGAVVATTLSSPTDVTPLSTDSGGSADSTEVTAGSTAAAPSS